MLLWKKREWRSPLFIIASSNEACGRRWITTIIFYYFNDLNYSCRLCLLLKTNHNALLRVVLSWSRNKSYSYKCFFLQDQTKCSTFSFMKNTKHSFKQNCLHVKLLFSFWLKRATKTRLNRKEIDFSFSRLMV